MSVLRALQRPGARVAIAALMLNVAFAVWQDAWAAGGQLVRHAIESPSLKRQMPVVVYVPDGYATSAKRYPVLYLLHGAGGDENAWCERGGLKARADDLIRRGIIPPALIVMPGCPTCWWVDGSVDKAETAFWSDLVPTITSRYRTIDARRGRVIAGLSAGGFGAIRYALKYPERFAAVAAFSPAVYAESPPSESAARAQPAFLGANGVFDQARWAEMNYPNLLPRYFGQPLRVPAYLVSGDNDGFGIAFETALLFKRLYERQPDITELRVIDGGHTWDVWSAAIERAMPFLFEHAALPEDDLPAQATGSGSPSTIAMRRR